MSSGIGDLLLMSLLNNNKNNKTTTTSFDSVKGYKKIAKLLDELDKIKKEKDKDKGKPRQLNMLECFGILLVVGPFVHPTWQFIDKHLLALLQ